MLPLDKATYRLLKKLYAVQRMEESELFLFTGHTDPHRLEPHSHFLIQHGMISVKETGEISDGWGSYIDAKRYYEIDLPGKAYVEGRAALAHNKRVENIRYIITTAIALAAFIKSFFFST